MDAPTNIATAIDSLALPAPHRAFLLNAVPQLMADERILGVLIGGSALTPSIDAYSDLDLTVAVAPAADEALLPERLAIVGRLGPLLAAFTGEHVGERRLIIALFGPPLLHVDLKFVPLPHLALRFEDPLVLAERGTSVTEALSRGEAVGDRPDPQWIEDRFWVWVHYIAAKIARGELFEAIDGLALLRKSVLGPLALELCDAAPNGVRRIEFLAPQYAEPMKATVPTYDAASCIAALQAAAALYTTLREQNAPPLLELREEARVAALAYLAAMERR